MTVEIPLTRGHVAIVDDEDAERVSAFKWCVAICAGKRYAQHSYRDQFNVGRSIYLHTFLTGWNYIDHKNGDGLDNRRANLRPATPAQNAANKRLSSKNSTGYKGVHLYRRTGRYRAYIGRGNQKTLHLGYFDTAEEAARAYDAAALEHFGEFARLNFPKEQSA